MPRVAPCRGAARTFKEYLLAGPEHPSAPPPAESLERLEAAIHALRHRLRNAYAVGGAIALASGRERPEHRDFAAELAQRFTALSMVQTRLLDGPGNATLAELAAELTAAFAGEGTIRLGELPDVRLDEQQARLVALVLGELCGNSVRHGVIAHGGSAIALTGVVADDRLVLEWRETLPPGASCPPDDEPGWRLMARMARAHGGSFVSAESAGELAVRLELPLGGG